jgi:hypothetical protein
MGAVAGTSGYRAPARPRVKLGAFSEGSLAPVIFAIVERGILHRPAMVSQLRAEVELATRHEFPPVRIVFGDSQVLVEDGPAVRPDLRVEGSLPDLISLMVAPLVGGLPSPMRARGRAALGMVVFRRVRIEGRIGLMRRILALIRL